jgi:chromosome segregation ATPase
LAANAALIAGSERDLEVNRLAYENAVAAYEKFVAEGAFATNVSAWLTKYNTEYGNLILMYSSRNTKQEALSDAKILLTVSKVAPVLPWSLKLARLQESLVKAEADLAANNAAADILEGVLKDPATLQEELDNINTQIEVFKAKDDSLSVVKKKLDEEITAVTSLKTAANTLKTAYLGYVTDTVNALKDIAAEEKKITDANKALIPLNADLAIKKATLASKLSSVTIAQSAYDLKLAAYNTANTNLQAAIDNVAAKLVAKNVAYNNWQGPPVVAANEAAYNTAVTAYNNAVTDKDAKQLVFNDAQTAKNTAEGELNTAKTNYETAFDAVYGVDPATAEAPNATSPQGLVNAQNLIIKNAEAAKLTKQQNYDDAKAKIAETKVAYDKALLDIAKYDDQLAVLNGKLTVVAKAISENTAWKTEMTNVKTTLGTELTNLKGVLTAIQTAIEGFENTVADLNIQIAAMEVDIAKLEDDVTKMEAELADLDNAIKTQEALVAYWKKMLDDAIAGR